ncbi:DNA polymerase III delta subunit [Halanaerobium saccharolyticum]|uniref:DNA polymerase III subunit delta n=1 Tax=Halanaerobium saccharolyticum TaxID=43595 RepID=A0A4R6LL54_9FIRM|nr:DNA polymerase III subunit delta [Halanaerobium saccharolyticum]TDO85458.1 DNA polymerase III delta subunit [Halanaerobium saccharolyticum]
MDLEEFIKNEKEAKKLYYIYADNSYLRNKFKEKFIEKFVPEAVRDFNLSYVNPGDEYLKRLSNAVQTPPMGAEKRFIISHFTEDDSLNQSEQERQLKIFKNIDQSASLLFLTANKVDKRKKFYLSLKKIAEYQEFETPRYRDLDQWIIARFRENNKKIDSRSVKMLENMFSNKLEILNSEIEKVVTRYPDQEKISYYDLKNIISREKFLEDEEIFHFLDLIGDKKTDQALLTLKEMLNKGVYPLYLLTMLKNQIELLMQVKFYSQYTQDNYKIAKKIGKHPYPVKKSLQRCRNFTQKELEKILDEILRANYHFLTGYYPDQNTALEMIIIKSIAY